MNLDPGIRSLRRIESLEIIKKRAKDMPLLFFYSVWQSYCRLLRADWAAANLATGTRKGEQLT